MENKNNLVELIRATPPSKIATLDVVKNKFIQNYNVANKSNMGEMMYSRQLVFFNQAITGNPQLQQCDPFSLYACFVTAAVKGYSFDPQDDEVYLIPRGGKAMLQRQAGVHVKRLKDTGQIIDADQAQLIYKGDIFRVSGGRVVEHSPTFETTEIVAGYVKFDLPNGREKYFIYYASDWESWRAKSENPKSKMKQGSRGEYLVPSPWDNYTLNGTQPAPGFLRTKLVLHACKEKCWSTGNHPLGIVESYANVETDDIDHEEIDPDETSGDLPLPHPDAKFQPTMVVEPAKEDPPPAQSFESDLDF